MTDFEQQVADALKDLEDDAATFNYHLVPRVAAAIQVVVRYIELPTAARAAALAALRGEEPR